MRPIFEYDHVRGILKVYVLLESRAETSHRWFAVFKGAGEVDEAVRVALGAVPPCYVPPIGCHALLGLIMAPLLPDDPG